MSLLARCKACSDWLLLPLAALHINCHRVTSKIRLTMPRVKISRADRNPWLGEDDRRRTDNKMAKTNKDEKTNNGPHRKLNIEKHKAHLNRGELMISGMVGSSCSTREDNHLSTFVTTHQSSFIIIFSYKVVPEIF